MIGKTRIELGIVEAAAQALLDAELQRRGSVSHFEALRRTKCGKKLILSLNLDWVNIDDGKFLLTTVVDITARLQAEEALRLENERFLRFVNSNIVGIIIGEPGGKILLANDYYLGLLGVSRQDLLDGRVNWRQFTPPEWLPADENAIREMRERGVCEPYEKEYIRADGTRVPVYVADAMIPGPNEQVASFVLDITQRKQAEKTLRESEERLRLAYEAADLGIWQQEPAETVEFKGILIYGPLNLPSTLPTHASEMYSKNLVNFLNLLTKHGKTLDVDFSDEILLKSCITYKGEIKI